MQKSSKQKTSLFYPLNLFVHKIASYPFNQYFMNELFLSFVEMKQKLNTKHWNRFKLFSELFKLKYFTVGHLTEKSDFTFFSQMDGCYGFAVVRRWEWVNGLCIPASGAIGPFLVPSEGRNLSCLESYITLTRLLRVSTTPPNGYPACQLASLFSCSHNKSHCSVSYDDSWTSK